MSSISLRLPESLHKRVRELAQAEGISINQFITLALAEKMSVLQAVEYLEERGSRGRRAKYDKVLRKVKDRPPVAGDELNTDAA